VIEIFQQQKSTKGPDKFVKGKQIQIIVWGGGFLME